MHASAVPIVFAPHSWRIVFVADDLNYHYAGRARVAKAVGMDVIAYTASPRRTPGSGKDKGFIVPGTGDPNGEIPSAWYSGLEKESSHEF
jgi:hypothetical protein